MKTEGSRYQTEETAKPCNFAPIPAAEPVGEEDINDLEVEEEDASQMTNPKRKFSRMTMQRLMTSGRRDIELERR